jgi:mono/diheme cytochrome c family protein
MIKDYRILAVAFAVAALAVGLSIVKALRTDYAGYQEAYYRQLDVNDYDIKINQLNIQTADGMQIDRCMTCHIGMANQDAADFELPIKTHPLIVAGRDKEPHDFTEIGCTVCHDGNGRGLNKADAHGHMKHWTLPLKTGQMIQSSCSQCHLVNEDLVGGELLRQGKTLFIEKACWTCHTVDGVSAGTKGPNLSNVGNLFQVDYLRTSLTEPTANIHSSKMPKFDWVEDHETVEALVIYLKSLRKQLLRSPDKGPVELDPTRHVQINDANITVSADRGKAIFLARDVGNVLHGGCVNCHSYRDSDGKLLGNFVAPELTYAHRSRGPEFLRRHIQDPTADVIDTIMPSFSDLSDAELDSLVAFLASMTYNVSDRSPETLYTHHCASCHGDDLDGQGPINQGNKLLDPLPRNFRHQFVVSYKGRLQDSVAKGIPGTAMPPWETLLSANEIDQIVDYVERLSTKDKKPFIRPDISMPKVGDVDDRTNEPIVMPDIERGRVAFIAHCTGCHDKLASGKGVNAYDLAHPLPRNLINNKFMSQPSITPLRLYRSIKMGVPGTPMPPFDRVLTDQGMLDVIAFLQSLNTDQKETSTNEIQ